jgi:imidazolonepropionase-like amidohydrolase
VPVAINVLDTPGGKEETVERRLENPAQLAAAGVDIAIITDDPVQDSRLFLRSGALAVRGGLSEEDALRALTLAPAEMIDLGDRIGSLTPGKEADLVVLSGAPFSTWTLVEQTWNDGAVVFDRADPAQAFYATGGDAAAHHATGETP